MNRMKFYTVSLTPPEACSYCGYRGADLPDGCVCTCCGFYKPAVSTPEAAGRSDDEVARWTRYALKMGLAARSQEVIETARAAWMARAALSIPAPPSGEQASTPEAAGRVDERLAEAERLLTDVQYAIAELAGVEIPYNRSRPLSACYNANANFLAALPAPPSEEQASAAPPGA